MPRSSSEMKNWHMHKGKAIMSLGVLIFIIGLMEYYQFSWPVITMVAGALIVLYGLSKKMMMK